MPPVWTRTEQQWLEQARSRVLRGDFSNAETTLNSALAEFPGSFDLRRVLAGICWQTGRGERAQALLRELLSERPEDPGSAFALAQILVAQARTPAAAQVLRTCFDHAQLDAELAIRAIELLDGAERKEDAAAIADRAIAAIPLDPRLHAYAGTLQFQLGEFTRAREHYLFALEHSPEACEWHVPYGLANAQRYTNVQHPDLTLFRDCLRRDDLSDKARSTLLFALGKAHDDTGDYAQAAACFREANAIAHALTKWSRKHWRRAVEARLSNVTVRQSAWDEGFAPIFIVGMPRSGTTLLAELLSRHPQVCNRGELPWIAKFAERPELCGDSKPAALAHAATEYAQQVRQNDATEARWFIDKQPLNFRYVDLILSMFPNARIIHCKRNARDNALSLWTQSFQEEVQGYSTDFDDIATVMQDCERLVALWRKSHAHAILEVHYEELVREAPQTLQNASAWLGLPESDVGAVPSKKATISTASAWQARQPLYTRAIGRWRNYLEFLPELLKFPDQPLLDG